MVVAVSLPLIGDFFASIAPGYLTFGVGVAFTFTKFLKPEFSFSFASYAHHVGLPAIVFKRLALDDPGQLDLKLLAADAISKFIPLVLLLLWWRFFSKYGKRESFEWVIVFFVLSTFPNTVLIGEALLSPMFGTWVKTETKDIEFAQALYWYVLIIMLMEIRELMLEDERKKPALPIVLEPGWKTKGDKCPDKCLSNEKQDLTLYKPNLKAIDNIVAASSDKQGSSDGQQRSWLSSKSREFLRRQLGQSRTDHEVNAQSKDRVDEPGAKNESGERWLSVSLRSSGIFMRNLFHSSSKVAPSAEIDGAEAKVDHTVELSKPGGSSGKGDAAAGQEQQSTESASIVDVKKPKANHDKVSDHHEWYTVDLDNRSLMEADKAAISPKEVSTAATAVCFALSETQPGCDDQQSKRPPRTEAKPASTGDYHSASESSWPGYDDLKKPWKEGKAANAESSSHSSWPGYDDLKKPWKEGKAANAESSSHSSWPGYDDLKKPPITVSPPLTDWSWPGCKVVAWQVLRLVKCMAKLPITYASSMGFLFALIAFHDKFTLPDLLSDTFEVLGGGTIGLSFTLLGMTFAKNIMEGRGVIPCGAKLLFAGFAARFIAAPIIMYISSEIVNIHGNLLTYAIVQVLVPQGTMAFGLAMYYDFKPCIMGTAIYTQMLVFIPISLGYFAILEAT
ncbi:unnamed protein product [Calypogeia fissa]